MFAGTTSAKWALRIGVCFTPRMTLSWQCRVFSAQLTGLVGRCSIAGRHVWTRGYHLEAGTGAFELDISLETYSARVKPAGPPSSNNTSNDHIRGRRSIAKRHVKHPTYEADFPTTACLTITILLVTTSSVRGGCCFGNRTPCRHCAHRATLVVGC
ncbi:hypothetical protein BC629DRAFT_915445 [Irpex lacteus]|nr:hypothetical protein BC629DRAFT_915445 [Irpex lacteus]